MIFLNPWSLFLIWPLSPEQVPSLKPPPYLKNPCISWLCHIAPVSDDAINFLWPKLLLTCSIWTSDESIVIASRVRDMNSSIDPTTRLTLYLNTLQNVFYLLKIPILVSLISIPALRHKGNIHLLFKPWYVFLLFLNILNDHSYQFLFLALDSKH